jgi:hypothetical protein
MSKGRTGPLVAAGLVAVGCAAACGVPPRAAAACRPVAGTVTRCVFVTRGAPAPSTPVARRPPLDDACTNAEFHFNGSPAGPPWSARGYTYVANLARMPHGDADRRAITKGRHTWDHTRAGCGLRDITNFKTSYGGRTRATMHSRRDHLSVVDFGSLAAFTRDPAAIAITFVWWENRHIVETDSRFEQPPSIPAGTFSWSVAAGRSERRWDLWGMAAHESGHALGLAHATSSRDNRLTMSPVEYLNSVRWRTLGRGDVLGLRALYP